MKIIKSRLKGVDDLKRRPQAAPAALAANPYMTTPEMRREMTSEQRGAWDYLQRTFLRDQENKRRATESPLDARAVGMGYIGPLMEDKGKANGSCNRTACQMPLAEEPVHQFMDGSFTGGVRLHYCAKCAADFDDWDHRSGDRIRIKRESKVAEPA